MKITKAELRRQLEILASVSGYKETATEAKAAGHEYYLHLEYSAQYGGYRIVLVHVERFSHKGVFGYSDSCERVKISEMYERIVGLKKGITERDNLPAFAPKNEIDFTRVNNDVNGNGRHVCHYLNFLKSGEKGTYELALKRAKQFGGRKFHNKQYGGGIVFQTSNPAGLGREITEFVNGL